MRPVLPGTSRRQYNSTAARQHGSTAAARRTCPAPECARHQGVPSTSTSIGSRPDTPFVRSANTTVVPTIDMTAVSHYRHVGRAEHQHAPRAIRQCSPFCVPSARPPCPLPACTPRTASVQLHLLRALAQHDRRVDRGYDRCAPLPARRLGAAPAQRMPIPALSADAARSAHHQ
jgi:hypothetical protein